MRNTLEPTCSSKDGGGEHNGAYENEQHYCQACMSRICEERQPKVLKCRSELKVIHMAGYCSDRDAYDTFKNIAMSALLSRTRRYPEDLAGCLDSRPPTPVPFQSHPRTDQLSHLEHNQVTLSVVLASKSGLSLSGAHRCMVFDQSLLVHVTT